MGILIHKLAVTKKAVIDFSTFGQEAATNFYIKNALRNA